MKITVTAKLRHGILLDAVKVCGSQVSLARRLHVTPTELGKWINLKQYPVRFFNNSGKSFVSKRNHVEREMLALTGKLFDDIWPEEFRARSERGKFKFQTSVECYQDMPIWFLQESGCVPRELPSPEQASIESELKESVKTILSTLSPREERVVRRRFGLTDDEKEYTLNEVAAMEPYPVTTTRIAQIEYKALRKLRHPSRANLVIGFVDPDEELKRTELRIQKQESDRVLREAIC